MWEAVHAALGSDVDAAIFGGFLSELVFIDDLALPRERERQRNNILRR